MPKLYGNICSVQVNNENAITESFIYELINGNSISDFSKLFLHIIVTRVRI